jgi:hypothetical protein
MLTEQNFRPFTNLLESGYTIQVELGDLVQDKQVWHDQAMRITVTLLDGTLEWKVFRGSRSRTEAGKWLDGMTSGAVSRI